MQICKKEFRFCKERFLYLAIFSKTNFKNFQKIFRNFQKYWNIFKQKYSKIFKQKYSKIFRKIFLTKCRDFSIARIGKKYHKILKNIKFLHIFRGFPHVPCIEKTLYFSIKRNYYNIKSPPQHIYIIIYYFILI